MINLDNEVGVDCVKKLVLYSDQVPGKSDAVDKALLQMINKMNPRIAYIPSRSDLTRKYFSEKLDYYHRLGIDDLIYFDIDIEYNSSRIDELLKCDAIHLSGGNTSYFLSSIRTKGFQDILTSYIQNGGILIGISAGSILMSSCIDVVSILHEGQVQMSYTKALCLNNFEFVPHWEKNHIYIDELSQYSRLKGITVYACSDSDGIIINNDEIRFIGNVIKIKNGIVD